MSTQVSTQQAPGAQEPKRGGGGGGGNRGRGGRRGGNSRRGGQGDGRNASGAVKDKQKDKADQVEEKLENPKEVATPTTVAKTGEDAGDEDDNVCWICAEPVKYWSVSECNHRTCHVCALRLRALYKKTDCTFCKEPQPTVIFTVSPETEFSTFKPEDISYKDAKLSIYFETQEMMEDTLILLKFNCPDPSCDYIGNGWGDLKLHTRAVHGKLMCDLCIRHKKVFSHEHALYPPNILPVHLPSMHHRHVKQIPPEKIEGGVHPMCDFCRECFFSVDEHYSHMREKHEECFVCKRNGVQYQYFQNYDSLERHFNTIHHPCTQSECRERKFVVFNTPLDLQAHMVEEHGASMSTKDKKDARKVTAGFQFEEVGGRPARHGGGTTRERDREPPPGLQAPRPQAQAGPSTAARPQAVPVNGRRAAFGSSLTDGSTPPPARPSASGSSSPLIDISDADPAVVERHALFITRLQSLAPNAVPAIKAAVRGYRISESSARDLILTAFNVLDNNLDHTASIVNGLVDLLEEEEKKQDLLGSWRGFNIEQRQQFPDLVPQAVGGGYAGITSGRVLNAKKTTASRSSQPSRQVWDRVAAAASSSSSSSPIQPRQTRTNQSHTQRFPPLPGASLSSTATPAPPIPGFRQPTRTTPWSASANTNPAPRVSVIEPPSAPATTRVSNKQKPPKLDRSLFPELPSSGSARGKPKVSGNVSLKNILGSNAPVVSAWTPGSGNGNGGENSETRGSNPVVDRTVGEGEGEESGLGRKGKKGKGKQKQTLFTLGSFPT
ncbi:hypothetical protein P691DRAFT_820683 [Macrolepiota fuliginosa MF-IS2]|uniref:RING-type E3 ubiquitin transferase n=1 Tax=Macrolepiota fuliginosa MF-IS2 TaxID=1400762 RepID=A0A9P6C3C3_9AGAR|nr:hypothetical protein P691DRAFT_820683 [Macrolepiota fuliginosa MF-IS2]